MSDRQLIAPGKQGREAEPALAVAVLPGVAFLVALAGRAAVLLTAPTPYAFDAFQRWAGREHLLVRDWLPATQSIIAASATLGGDHLAARWVLAVVASLGCAAGAVVARQLGGRLAGWLFLPVCLFGPYLAWSAALYQEGTFLTLLMGGLALALRARGRGPDTDMAWLPADLLMGALALVRYEGWPVVAAYLLWRRSPRAGVALWGVAVWLAVKAAGAEGFEPSPITYADWEGLPTRWDPQDYGASVAKLLRQSGYSGGLAVAALGAFGAARLWRQHSAAVGLIAIGLVAQLAATAGWLAGLETAIVRMQVVPVVLCGLLAAGGLGPLLGRSRAGRAAGLVLALLAAGLFLRDGLWHASRAAAGVRHEQALVEQLQQSPPSGPWLLQPRAGLGTRSRHDGCEIVAGLSNWTEGEDFHCVTWGGPAPTAPAAEAVWQRGGYRLSDLP